MAKISWINSSGGTWTLGSNWSGGNVPGPNDNATIAVAPGGGLTDYAVYIADTDVTVRSLTLDQSAAALWVGDTDNDPSMLSTHLYLQAGTLALQDGTLTGTVTQTGGQLALESSNFGGASGTLQSVTWQGDLNPFGYQEFYDQSVLTIEGSLTLTGAGGKGPGALTLDQTDVAVEFQGQQTFNNATVALGSSDLGGEGGFFAPTLEGDTLTLGTHLLIDASGYANIDPGTQVTNDGTISTSGSTSLLIGNINANSGTFSNNAQIAVAAGGTLTIGNSDFINSGTVTVATGAAVEIDQASGGSLQNTGSIVVDGALLFGGHAPLSRSRPRENPRAPRGRLARGHAHARTERPVSPWRDVTPAVGRAPRKEKFFFFEKQKKKLLRIKPPASARPRRRGSPPRGAPPVRRCGRSCGRPRSYGRSCRRRTPCGARCRRR